MIIFSTSIRSGPANTAGSENSIPAKKPTTKKLFWVGGGKVEGDWGERELLSFFPFSLSLEAKKNRISGLFCLACLSLSPQSPFLPIPYPFRHLLHRLFFVLYFCGMIAVRTRAVSVEVTHGYSSPVTRAGHDKFLEPRYW